MRRIGLWWLCLLAAGACATPHAQYPSYLLRNDPIPADPRVALALEQTLASDASGASPAEALRPILALPEHGCANARQTLDEPCKEPEWLMWQPPLRDSTLRKLVNARFDADAPRKPSEALTRLALGQLELHADAGYIAADGYAKLGDRAAAERALRKAPISDDQRDMRMGLWFNDPDLATHGALAQISGALPLVRIDIWDEIEAAVVAAGRIDLEKQILRSRLDWFVDAESQALRAAARLVELGEEKAVRAELERIAVFPDRPAFAWVSFMGFLRMGDRARAEAIAAPWLASQYGSRCFDFMGDPPKCDLGFHMREALGTGDHPIR